MLHSVKQKVKMQCYLVNWFPSLSFLSLFSFLSPSFPPFLPYFLSSSFFASPPSLFLHCYLPLSLLFLIFILPSFPFNFPYFSFLHFPSLSSTLFYFYFLLFIFPFFFFLRGETPVLSCSVFLASDPVLHVYTCLRSVSKQKTEM